jgi:hypothetical protein
MAPCLRAGRVLEFVLEELDLKASFGLGTFATFFQAEIFSIFGCSDYCLKECMTGKTICICSDSRAALLVLSLHTVSSRLVLQCRIFLQELSIQNKVQLFLVPGHFGIIWNEEADGLRTQILGKPILSVSKYEEMSAGSSAQFSEKSGRFETRV